MFILPMPMDKLVQADTISTLQITYLNKIKVRSQLIYSICIVVLVFSIAALPFIFLDISVKSSGIIQTETEKTQLLVPISGRLIRFCLKDNQKISLFDTVLVIDPSLPRKQTQLLGDQTASLNSKLTDIQVLISHAEEDHLNADLSLQNGQYQADWQQFIQELTSASGKKLQASRIYKRYEVLHNSKVISDAEFEKYTFDNDQSIADYKFIIKRYKTQWQIDANQLQTEFQDIKSRRTEVEEQNKFYVLKAPVSGSIQNLTGIQSGAFVFANQKIADISPNTGLYAICYVGTSDIGLLKKNQIVRCQIDAFNYNQWGILTGKIIDISDDILLNPNQRPVYKVKCLLDSNHLTLKNGYKGFIKKGMAFNASFLVTKRSLWQLLYDKVDDWFNPNGLEAQTDYITGK